jgi:hypothetical protein
MLNLKLQLGRLADGLRLLAKHGPMKHPDQRGSAARLSLALSLALARCSSDACCALTFAMSLVWCSLTDEEIAASVALRSKDAKDSKDSKAAALPNPHADPNGIRTGKRTCSCAVHALCMRSCWCCE